MAVHAASFRPLRRRVEQTRYAARSGNQRPDRCESCRGFTLELPTAVSPGPTCVALRPALSRFFRRLGQLLTRGEVDRIAAEAIRCSLAWPGGDLREAAQDVISMLDACVSLPREMWRGSPNDFRDQHDASKRRLVGQRDDDFSGKVPHREKTACAYAVAIEVANG